MLPDTGITSTMVGNELGTSARNWSTLCTHDNINIFAKYKPVRYNTNTGITEGLRRMATYGVSTPDFNFYSWLSVPWVYARPRGSAYNEPYRIGDFRGYNHLAICPIEIVWDKRLVMEAGDDVICNVYFRELEESFKTSNSISYDNIYRNPDMRITICLFDERYKVKAYYVDMLRYHDRLAVGSVYHLYRCSTSKFVPGERVIARIMLTDPPASAPIPSYGYSLEYIKDVDTWEFTLKPFVQINPPILVYHNITIVGHNEPDREELYLLDALTISYSNNNNKPGEDFQTLIEVECNSRGGVNDTPRLIKSFTWNVGDPKDFTETITGMELGNREYIRKENFNSPTGTGYDYMDFYCRVYATVIRQTGQQRVEIGNWQINTEAH